jgi:lysophospholipase L1-like esterase
MTQDASGSNLQRARRVAGAFAALLFGLITLRGSMGLMALMTFEFFLRVFGGVRSSIVAILLGPGRVVGANAPDIALRGGRRSDVLFFALALGGWILAAGTPLALPATAVFMLATLFSLAEAVTGRPLLNAASRQSGRESIGAMLRPSTVIGRIDAALQRVVRKATQGPRVRLRLAMIVVSALLAIALGLGGLKLYARQLGIRTASFHNDLNYWEPDPELGFVNRANIDEFNHFVLRDRTNDRGFRHSRETKIPKPDGTTRIVAIGDSVTWGVGVDERRNFCGLLEAGLAIHGDFEVVNAGVIGYSAWQEWRFFEERVLPLEPDVVLINLCENDVLPTQDPFDNLRGILTRHFNGLLEDPDNGLGADDRMRIGELILLQEGDSVWGGLGSAPAELQETARRVLVLTPYEHLARRCESRGIRLICLLIPPVRFDPVFEGLVETLKPVLEGSSIETIDFRELLSTEGEKPAPAAGLGFRRWLPFRLRDLENIQLHRRMEWIHRERNYFDSVHLSRRGHAVVAEEIQRRLQERR